MLEHQTQVSCAGPDGHAESVSHVADTEGAESTVMPERSPGSGATSDAIVDDHITNDVGQVDPSPAIPDDGSCLTDSEAQLVLSSISLPSEPPNGDSKDAESLVDADTKRPNSLRNTSSKIASLRAAFEKGSAAVDMSQVKRRFYSADRGPERTSEKEREYWKEIGRLRDERDKEAEMKEASQARCVDLENEIKLLKQAFGERNGRTEADETASKDDARDSKISSGRGSPALISLDEAKLEQDESLRDEMPAAQPRLPNTRPTQVEVLEQHIADLKRTISASTRMDPVRADTDLAQEMGTLHHELQNWIVNTYRRAKPESTTAELVAKVNMSAEAPYVDGLRRTYSAFDPSAKLAIYQSTAMTYMMDIFTANLLFGLGSSEQEWQARLLQTAESLTHVLSPHAYNRWRAVTLDVIRHTNSLQEATEALGMSIVEKICTILAAVSDIPASDSQRLALNSIMRRAISLAHLFNVQRAQYEFALPKSGSDFRGETMEDVAAEDRDPGPCRPVHCATFLSVVKVGDECGDCLHLRNVLVKAKVLCSIPDDT